MLVAALRRALRSRPTLAVASLALALAAAEGVVRVFEIGPEISAVYRENYRLSDDPVLRYELVPGSPDGESRINADGMRDRDRELAKAPGVFRIACLGDSITYGFGVGRAAAYPARLERRFARSPRGADVAVEVLNFGVTGYNIEQTLQNLRVRALAYQPDVVITQYALNDPQEYSSEMENLESALTGAERNYRQRLLERGRRNLLASRLFALAAYTWQSTAPAGRTRAPARPDAQWLALQGGSYAEYFAGLHADPEAWGRVERGFGSLATTARQHGFEALVVVFPILEDLDRYPLRSVHERVAAAARAVSLPVLDLLASYERSEREGERSLAVNSLHPNGLGHEIAARAIADELAARGWLPRASPFDASAAPR
jgi:lysophospholipase L1-like esterase